MKGFNLLGHNLMRYFLIKDVKLCNQVRFPEFPRVQTGSKSYHNLENKLDLNSMQNKLLC